MNKQTKIFASVGTLILVAALAGCATYKECGLKECPADMDLSKSVQQKLDQHAELGAPDSIRVMTIDHIVYLNGQVDGGLERRNAEAFAKQVPGVTKVVNNIVVEH
jgi:osmotically-inducible protein OsmY